MNDSTKLPRTAKDPMCEYTDYKHDALLAELEGRIPIRCRRRYAENRERDVSRRRGAFLRLVSKSDKNTSIDQPGAEMEKQEQWAKLSQQLPEIGLEALTAECLRAYGIPVGKIASILQRTPAHISRLHRRAQITAEKFD